MFLLDKNTTRILSRAIDKMGGQESIDLPLEDHPLLRLQRLDDIETGQGDGYSLAIGQLKSVHPPRYEARMILLVVDRRDRRKGKGTMTVFPVSFNDDVNDVSEIGALLAKGKVRKFSTIIQQSLAEYARTWLAGLSTAGYF